MEYADKDGVYEIDTADGETTRIFIAKGDPIPEGASFQGAFTPSGAEAGTTAKDERSEQKAKGTAPQNKSQ